MCDQCLCNPIYFNQPIKGFTLARARKSGIDWKKGQWALIECNDPTYTWYTTPVIGKDFTEEFQTAFYSQPESGHKLVDACIKAGYDLQKDGFVTAWLFDHLAAWIATTEFNQDEQTHDNFQGTDYNIKKQPLDIEAIFSDGD
jgi:hypothetical protein